MVATAAAAAFARSLSLPIAKAEKEKSFHVRSTSLPCKSHPVIAQVQDQIQKLKSWEETNDVCNRTSTWLCEGLNELKNLHDVVDDLFQLPQTQEALRRKEKWTDELLDDFLKFLDVYGIVRGALLSLREHQLAAQVALRRRDNSLYAKLSSYLVARKKMDKEMAKLVSLLKDMTIRFPAQAVVSDAELATLLHGVKFVTVTVTVFLVSGISRPKTRWVGLKFLLVRSKNQEEGVCEVESTDLAMKSIYRSRKQPDEKSMQRAIKRMEMLEDCISSLESGTESVFRSLINTRVSLLNILTQ